MLSVMDTESERDFAILVDTESVTDTESERDFAILVDTESATDTESERDFVTPMRGMTLLTTRSATDRWRYWPTKPWNPCSTEDMPPTSNCLSANEI